MTIDIKHGRRLLAAATPGPWEMSGWDSGDTLFIGGPNPRADDYELTGNIPETPRRKANHELIAWLRNNAAALLDAHDECGKAKTLACAAFVAGSAWARFKITQATAFSSELEDAEAEAKRRYPFIPPYYWTEIEALRDRLANAEAAIREMKNPTRKRGT